MTACNTKIIYNTYTTVDIYNTNFAYTTYIICKK